VAGQWFSPSTLVSSTNKTDHHDIAEILLKVALNTITLTLIFYKVIFSLLKVLHYKRETTVSGKYMTIIWSCI
jgi:hypothetical protein